MPEIRESFSKRMGEMIADVMGSDAIKDMYEKGNLTEEQKQKPSGLLALDLGIVTAGAKNALLIAQAAERTLQTVERIEAAIEKAPDLAKSIRSDIRTIAKANSRAGKVGRFFTGAAKPEIAEKVKTWNDLEHHKEERLNNELGFQEFDVKEFQHLGLSDVSGAHFSGVAIVSGAGGASQPVESTPEQQEKDAVTLAQTINYLAREEEIMTKRALKHQMNYNLDKVAAGKKDIGFFHINRHDGLKEIAAHFYDMAADMLEKEGYPDAAAQIRSSETIQDAHGTILGKTWEEDKASRFGLPAEIVKSAYDEQMYNDRNVTEWSMLWRGTSVSAMNEILTLSATMEAMPKILKGAGVITATEAQNMADNTKSSLPNKDHVHAMIKDLSRSPFGHDEPKQEQGKARLVKVEL